MAITEQQSDRALQALGKKLRPCPMCGAKSWQVIDIVTGLPFEADAIVVGGGTTIPMLLLICNACHFLAHFSAVRLGLVPGAAAQPKGKQT